MVAEPAPLALRRIAAESFASGAERLVYNSERDEVSALNQTATEIWELCDGTRDVAQVAGVLAEKYGVEPALLLPDVAMLVEALRSRGLLAGDASASGTA